LGTGTALTSGISATATQVTLSSPILTGIVSFNDGSAAAPSITNTGDTNTGIYFSANEAVSVTTGAGLRGTFNSTGLVVAGNVTSTGTVEPAGDTTVGDNAAFGYTSVLGAILTGQGTTNDVTLVNDADATVLGIPTGTVNVTMAGTLDVVGDITGSTLNADGDTSAGDNAAIGYTTAEGLILTGQGSTSDITLKNDADATVFTVPTGTDDILFPDNAKAMFGAGSDLQIYHDGSNSNITDAGTGDLILRASNDIFLSNVAGDSIYGRFAEGGAVSLYHNGSVKLATASTGITMTGEVTATGFTGDVTGNADTATVLATARTIGGVSFNGSANINLPGVNSAGNQNTTGSAATLTTARTIGGVSFNGSANINLPGVNTAGNQNTSGTAATVTGAAQTNITSVGTLTGIDVKKGTTTAASGQPSGTFAATVFHATNSSTSHGLLVKNNWAAAASTVFEVGLDIVGGAYRSYHKIDGIGAAVWSPGGTTAISLASNGVVTFAQIPVMPANSIDSDEYIDGSIDRAHLAADIIDGTKIADDVINSEHYAADSIDEEHIANDAVGSAELKTLSTLLIKNSAGTTLKTLHGAGA
jgi:hypothetical protein